LNKAAFYIVFLFLTSFIAMQGAHAQTLRDSSGTRIEVVTAASDSTRDSLNAIISPRKAAIRSAIIPGWGQVYVRKDLKGSFVRKYWKLPIIYGALGTSAGVFAYNLSWYRRTRFAYKTFSTKDTLNYGKVHPELRTFNNDLSFLQQSRNEFRRDVDYSVLFFVLLWGLNVVDATVDAHLKTFDVSPDLSLFLKPGYSDLAGTHGISLVLQFK
jgi:hypothetical protein